ncbi:hypothetical protein chiPu_0031503 [Chiloscyllium punctatum]|uniref:Uncharacterized protein n=1 Tax=Chiloscyllium punctatum TaxID=137246 RepID=A0A401TYF6_CHIPU|nr:hypothetical protein [Chiloscyllium punctatum]
MIDAPRSYLGHLRGAIGRAQHEAFGKHDRSVIAGAAAEFEDRAARRQQLEEADQPGGRCFRPPGIGLGIAPVELQRGVVHGAPGRQLSARPSISRMF